jgi:hypothetical protein
MDIKITERQREKIIDFLTTKKTGDVIKLLGGVNNLLKIFNNDLKEFYKSTGFVPYKFDSTGENMYIDNLLIESLNLEDSWNKKEKKLGDFRWTSSGINYTFTAHATSPFKSHLGQELRRVAGTCGDHGFGYSFISQRNKIGKRGRAQIFKQIIEKYNLKSYFNEDIN